jgi:hypothetical protein
LVAGAAAIPPACAPLHAVSIVYGKLGQSCSTHVHTAFGKPIGAHL